MMRAASKLAARLKRIGSDPSGVSAVEFAFVLPILVSIYIGGFQMSDAIAAKRKVTRTARTLSDLTTQYVSVSTSDLDSILGASTQVLYPYSTNNATAVVSQVSIDGSGNAKVVWSRGLNATALIAGTTVTLPGQISTQYNTNVIVSQITYNYIPVVASSLFGQIPMSDQMIMNPRRSASIPCTNC